MAHCSSRATVGGPSVRVAWNVSMAPSKPCGRADVDWVCLFISRVRFCCGMCR
jgi:hypothetical protein